MFKDVQTYAVLQGDDLVTGTIQDCTPYAERAKAMHNEGHHGTKDMRLAATIPVVMIERYCNDNGVSFHECMANKEHMRRIVTDPANAHFRVWPGRIA